MADDRSQPVTVTSHAARSELPPHQQAFPEATYHDLTTRETTSSTQGHTLYATSNPPREQHQHVVSEVRRDTAATIHENAAVAEPEHTRASSADTLTQTNEHVVVEPPTPRHRHKDSDGTSISTTTSSQNQREIEAGTFEPIKSAQNPQRPNLNKRKTITSEADLFRALSRRRTATSDVDPDEERDEVERLMSRMFGKERQKHSEEEKTRHSGVVFRDLTVKGVGLGASLQPTIGDIFLNLPRFLKNLLTKGPKAATGKPPTRELLSNFNGCVRPGELLLVLGRPGSGCSTFLKVFCNQRAGYKEVQGDVTYGGTDARRMAKDFRGEVIYQPEDDLHYATLTVKQTLKFALTTRTPGKESRLENESKKDYVAEFLRVALKLLWIEHTADTKVGNDLVRGGMYPIPLISKKLTQT